MSTWDGRSISVPEAHGAIAADETEGPAIRRWTSFPGLRQNEHIKSAYMSAGGASWGCFTSSSRISSQTSMHSLQIRTLLGPAKSVTPFELLFEQNEHRSSVADSLDDAFCDEANLTYRQYMPFVSQHQISYCRPPQITCKSSIVNRQSSIESLQGCFNPLAVIPRVSDPSLQRLDL